MKKTYQTPNADVCLFRPVCDLAITWTDLNNGTGGNQSQDGAVASKNDIIIKL